jgi:hypothetical protein
MGLDMYLTAEKYFSPYDESRKKPRVGGVPKGFLVTTVCVRAAYWRKANQIHAWFVKNVQNGEDECREHHVSREKLEELVALCKLVIAEPEKAPELLPIQSGFFFGNTEFGEYYFENLKDTVEQIERVLSGFDGKVWDFTYRSSW